jgi:hypothetical protein
VFTNAEQADDDRDVEDRVEEPELAVDLGRDLVLDLGVESVSSSGWRRWIKRSTDATNAWESVPGAP